MLFQKGMFNQKKDVWQCSWLIYNPLDHPRASIGAGITKERFFSRDTLYHIIYYGAMVIQWYSGFLVVPRCGTLAQHHCIASIGIDFPLSIPQICKTMHISLVSETTSFKFGIFFGPFLEGFPLKVNEALYLHAFCGSGFFVWTENFCKEFSDAWMCRIPRDSEAASPMEAFRQKWGRKFWGFSHHNSS